MIRYTCNLCGLITRIVDDTCPHKACACPEDYTRVDEDAPPEEPVAAKPVDTEE